MSKHVKDFPRLRAAAIDERTQLPYFRKNQLYNLQRTLVENASDIQNAIVHDSGYTLIEAKVEHALAVSCVVKHYKSVQPEKEIEEEYSIANGKDNAGRRQAVGVVYIEPASHTRFYSVIAPLSSAIASGNCVLVLLDQNLRELTGLLEKLLGSSLDTDIFDVARSRPSEDLLADCVQVLQNGTTSGPTTKTLVSNPEAKTVAIVDRTANLEQAAKALASARFSFGGISPYAPDLILVNEFAKKKFLSALVQHSIKYMTEENGVANGTPSGKMLGGKRVTDELKGEYGVQVVTSGSEGTILNLEKRSSPILRKKISERCIVVHGVSSMDDALDVANSSGDYNLLATYLFANPPTGKYLSQFIKSDAAFVNHVPVELLVGPAAPSNQPVDQSLRYPSDLFTVPCPQFLHPTSDATLVGEILLNGSAQKLAQLRAAMMADRPMDEKQNARAMKSFVGFFEQGIRIGVSLAATPVVLGLGAASYFGARMAWTRWR